MLPPFRVKRLVPSDSSEQGPRRPSTDLADGVVKMSKEAYDALLQRNPQAALHYIDEEDGDVILVGSALELSHRLQEPIPPQPPVRNHAFRNPELVSTSHLHSFNINRQEPVLSEWRALARETEEQKANRADVAFGEASPLSKNAPKLHEASPKNQQHAKRWASYAEASGMFEPSKIAPNEEKKEDVVEGQKLQEHTVKTPALNSTPATVQQSLKVAGDFVPDYILETSRGRNERSPEELRLASYSDLPKEDHVMSSTLQVFSTPKQRDNYQPLLDLFQDQLSKLGTASLKTTVAASSSGTPSPQPATAPDPPEEVPESAASSSHVPPVLACDPRLADSLRSIMAGVGQLTSALQQSRNELHNTITLARQDFPNGLKEAVKASAAAIDALRGFPTQSESATVTPAPEPVTISATASTVPADDARATDADAAADTIKSLLEHVERQDAELADLRIRQHQFLMSETSTKSTAQSSTLPKDHTSQQPWIPKAIVLERIVQYPKGVLKRPIHEYLVQFEGRSSDDETWYKDTLLLPGFQHLIHEYQQRLPKPFNSPRGFPEHYDSPESIHFKSICKTTASQSLFETTGPEIALRSAGMLAPREPPTLWDMSSKPFTPALPNTSSKPFSNAFPDSSSKAFLNAFPSASSTSFTNAFPTKPFTPAWPTKPFTPAWPTKPFTPAWPSKPFTPAWPTTASKPSSNAFPSTASKASTLWECAAFPSPFDSNAALPNASSGNPAGPSPFNRTSTGPSPFDRTCACKSVHKPVTHDISHKTDLTAHHAGPVPDTAMPPVDGHRQLTQRPWAQSEDDLLQELTSGKSQAQLSDTEWANIAKKFLGRGAFDVQERSLFLKLLKPSAKLQSPKPIPIWAQQAKSSRVRPTVESDDDGKVATADVSGFGVEKGSVAPADEFDLASLTKPIEDVMAAVPAQSIPATTMSNNLLEAAGSSTALDQLQPPLQPAARVSAPQGASSATSSLQTVPHILEPIKGGGMSDMRRQRIDFEQDRQQHMARLRQQQFEQAQARHVEFRKRIDRHIDQARALQPTRVESTQHRQELARAQQRHLEQLHRQQAEQMRARRLEQEQQQKPHVPAPAVPPPPVPAWLATSLTSLRSLYPRDSFHAEMSHNFMTNQWQPVIKCDHCPSTSKTSHSCSNATDLKRFEKLHLGNINHKRHVQAAVTGNKSLGDRMAYMSSHLRPEFVGPSSLFLSKPEHGLSGMTVQPQPNAANDINPSETPPQVATLGPQIAIPQRGSYAANGQFISADMFPVGQRSHDPRGQAPSTYPGGASPDFQMQLRLLEEQNKRRLKMARPEHDAARHDIISPPLAPSSPTQLSVDEAQHSSRSGGSLADYQMQLMLLEQQNKQRLEKARQESEAREGQKAIEEQEATGTQAQAEDLPSPSSQASDLKVEKCVETLREMGYAPAEKVEAVAAACNGDLFTVIELLEEDEREWKRREKGKGKSKEMPGSWNDELYSWDDMAWK